jgi:hypothetical protein
MYSTLIVFIFNKSRLFRNLINFSDGPSTDKDPEEKKKEPAISSQNSPEAREER